MAYVTARYYHTIQEIIAAFAVSAFVIFAYQTLFDQRRRFERLTTVAYFGVHVVLFATMALLTVYVMCMKSFVDPVRFGRRFQHFSTGVTPVREVP